MINDAHGIEVGGLLDAARLAGEQIMGIYEREFEVEYKGDHSPLTEADKVANDAIMTFLEAHYPEHCVGREWPARCRRRLSSGK